MKTFEEKKRQYAQLLIKFGLNLQKGQNLILNAPIEAHDFVLLLAEVAYEAGAREIFYRRQSERLEALKYEKAPEEVFGSYPQWLADGYTEEVQKNCAVLSLYMEDPKGLKKLILAYLKRKSKLELALSNATRILSQEMGRIGLLLRFLRQLGRMQFMAQKIQRRICKNSEISFFLL